MKNALFPAGLLLAAAALTGCLFGTSEEPAGPGTIIETIPYKVAGNTIIALAHITTHTYCNGDDLVTDYDTLEADTVAFRIEGSALEILPRPDTLESGAVVLHVSVFKREGSGSGLRGLWSSDRQEYRVVSGTPSEEETAVLEEDQKFSDNYRSYSRSWVRFTGRKIISSIDQDHARQFIGEWNGDLNVGQDADSSLYAITLKALDKNTVELKGGVNGETVLVTVNSERITYSSSTPGHAPHRFDYMPKTCPNGYTPQWYAAFKEANLKAPVLEKGFALQKRAKTLRKSGKLRHFPFGPLKTIPSLLN